MALFTTPQERNSQERTARKLQLTHEQEHELLRTGLLLPRLNARDLAAPRNFYHHLTHPSAHLREYTNTGAFVEFYYQALHGKSWIEAAAKYCPPSVWWRAGTSNIPQLTIGLHGAPAGNNITIYPIPVLCPATHRLTAIAYRCYNWRITAQFPELAHAHSTGKTPLVALRRYVAAVSKALSAANKTALDNANDL